MFVSGRSIPAVRHRNVIYRDGKDLADQVVPLSSYDTDDPEKLWAWMQDCEDKNGGKLLAIPHGGNLSNGPMFDNTTLSGKALSEDYAQRRMKYEPMYEITQMKGDGEAHPMLSSDDEFADYATWDAGTSDRSRRPPICCRRNTCARPGSADSPTTSNSGPIHSSSASSDPPMRTLGFRRPPRATSSARSAWSSRRPTRSASRR